MFGNNPVTHLTTTPNGRYDWVGAVPVKLAVEGRVPSYATAAEAFAHAVGVTTLCDNPACACTKEGAPE